MAGQTSYTWMAFVAMTFVVAGLMGVFATYALPVPFERALARDAALDEALAAAGRPDETARLEALRPALSQSGPAIENGEGAVAGRIQRERAVMREQFQAEAQALARRLRLMIVIVTSVCAAFACAIVGGMSRRAPGETGPEFTSH
jgi:hypothetical protein